MRSTLAGLRTLVVPWGAAAGAARLVVGPDVPAELTAFYVAHGFDFVRYAIIWYLDSPNGEYFYECSPGFSTYDPLNGVYHARGVRDENAVVIEFDLLDHFGAAADGEVRWDIDTQRGTGAQTLVFIGSSGARDGVRTGALSLEDNVDLQLDGLSQGRGLRAVASATSNSSAIGTTETAILTVSSFTWQAQRAYRVSFGNKITCSASTNVGTFRLRKTNATGAVLGDAGAYGPSPAAPDVAASSHFYVRRTLTTDLTATVVLTLQASAGTVTQTAASTQPRFVIIEDVGDAGDWTHAVAIS